MLSITKVGFKELIDEEFYPQLKVKSKRWSKVKDSKELLGNVLECRYIGNDFVIAAAEPSDGVIRVSHEGCLQWRQTWPDALTGGQAQRINGLDYNPDVNRVLVAVRYLDGTHIVYELNADTGAIIRSLSGFEPEFWGGAVCYDPPNPDSQFWISETANNRVLRVNWDGDILWNSTTLGLALSAPTSVDVSYRSATDTRDILIGDSGNNRLLRVNEAGVIQIGGQFPFPAAKGRFAEGASLIQIYFCELVSAAVPDGGNRWPYSIISSGVLTRPYKYFIPYLTKPVAFKPSDPLTIAFAHIHGLIETKLSFYDATKFSQLSRTIDIWNAKSIDAATPESSPPIPSFILTSTVYVKATQTGTLYIDVARFVERFGASGGGAWDGDWDQYDSIVLAADTLASYTPTGNLGIFRFRVDLDDDGEADAWIVQEAIH